MPMRTDNRAFDEIRKLKITPNFLKNPLGSALVELGNTMVLCTASVEEKVPPFLKDSGTGWITAEYAFIPGATTERTPREIMGRKGRSVEIQRLIGRTLRAVVDLVKLGERTIWIDCEVLNADGGTRTASVIGGFVALKLAIKKLIEREVIKEDPVLEYMAGISVGKIGENFLLDLNYEEDIAVEVDANFFLTESGKVVEVQVGAETTPFSWEDFERMKQLAEKGIKEIIEIQKKVIENG